MIRHPDVIRSRDNALVKRFARLAGSSRQRADDGVAIVEGWHLIRACLESPAFGPVRVQRILVSEAVADAAETLSVLALAAEVPVGHVAADVFARLAPATGPNAAVALVRLPEPARAPTMPQDAFELWLEDLQDPGNVGTLIRTAAAAGATAVRVSPGCADPWSPKVLRAGMGGHFVVPLEPDADLAARARSVGLAVHGLAAEAGSNLYETPLARPLAWVLGNEGAGLSATLRASVRQSVRIPMAGAVESLNVAVAGAIALFETVRREGRIEVPPAESGGRQ